MIDTEKFNQLNVGDEVAVKDQTWTLSRIEQINEFNVLLDIEGSKRWLSIFSVHKASSHLQEL